MDERLSEAFRSLELSDTATGRVEARILTALEAHAGLEAELPSLTREWLSLLSPRCHSC
jgi:hypothetical protein